MTDDEYAQLAVGDHIRLVRDPEDEVWIVTAIEGTTYTAVRTITVRDPVAWRVVAKVTYRAP